MTREAVLWEGQTLDELRARWGRAHVHVFPRISSTNEQARRLAERGAPCGTVVVADEQSAGRGVGAHRWHSPKGAGLYLSLVLRPRQVPNTLVLPLLAGLGTARAVGNLLGGVRVAVKWPNDLIVEDRKAGGVLSEASWAGRAVNHVVIGVGINVHQSASDFPASLQSAAISLDMAARRVVSRLELADLVIAELEARCASPREQLDRALLAEFDELDWLRDRRCVVRKPDGTTVEGTAAGVASDGALLFRPERGALERITTGRIIADALCTPDY